MKTNIIVYMVFITAFLAGMPNASATEFITNSGVQIDSMDSAANFTPNSAAAGNWNEEVIDGRRGITVKGVNALTIQIDKKFASPINFGTYNALHFWLHVDETNQKNISSISVLIASNTGFTSFIVASVQKSELVPGWNHIDLGKSNFKSGGGSDTWGSPKRIIRLRVTSVAGTNSSVTFDDLRVGITARPVAIITFDDGYQGVLDNASSVLARNGQNATLYVPTTIPDNIAYNPGYLSWDNLTTLYNKGWDISSHTEHHSNLLKVSSAVVTSELVNSRNALLAHGFNRSANFLSYPNGGYNDVVIESAKKAGYVMARSISNDAKQAHIPQTDPGNMYFKTSIVDIVNTTSIATIKNRINQTIENNGLTVLLYHNIVSGNADKDTQTREIDFAEISNYLKSRSADIDVMTMSEYYAYLHPADMPSPEKINTDIQDRWWIMPQFRFSLFPWNSFTGLQAN